MEGVKAFVNEWGFVLIGILTFGFAVIFVIRELLRQRRYDRSPEFESRGTLVSRFTGSGNSGPRAYPAYWGVFQTPHGELLELRIPVELYATVTEGAELIITWKQGKVETFREVEQ